jgi:two-component system sensor histidine kinase EvgS
LAEALPIQRRLTLLALAKLGGRADTAANGAEVVERFRTEPYDVVLIDCGLEGLDAWAVAEAIRDLERPTAMPSRTPAVLIGLGTTGVVGERERCLKAGMNHYLTRPFTVQQLSELLSVAPPHPAGQPSSLSPKS